MQTPRKPFKQAWLWLGLFAALPLLAAPDPAGVSVLRFDWQDASRNRAVPARLFLPPASTAACPVVIFSHGLGGSREGYTYLGTNWAAAGLAVCHIQHVGSDDSVWRGNANAMASMRRAAADLSEILNRPRDVSFAIDELTRLNADAHSPLFRRLDLTRIGVAGHSFGAYTALAAAGRSLESPSGRTLDVHDPRITACIAMSAPARGSPLERASYARFTVPCLHMTGTADASPIGDTTPAQRRIPYDACPGPDQYLIIFKDADHMVFSGRGSRVLEPAAYPPIQALIVRTSLAFWKACLMQDAAARTWLGGDALPKALGAAATLERKQDAHGVLDRNHGAPYSAPLTGDGDHR